MHCKGEEKQREPDTVDLNTSKDLTFITCNVPANTQAFYRKSLSSGMIEVIAHGDIDAYFL